MGRADLRSEKHRQRKVETMKNSPAVFDAMRVTALDKAMHYHFTFNRPTPAQGAQWPNMQEAPQATADEVIATAQKFLGFLLVEKQAMQVRAKR